MADDIEGSVRFYFEFVDEITDPADTAAASCDTLQQELDTTRTKTDQTIDRTDKMRIKNIEVLSGLQSLQSGLSSTVSAMNVLEIGSESTRESITKMAAGIQLMVGTAQTVKGAVTIFNTLNSALKSTAVMSIIAQAAANPLIGLAGAAAVGAVAGYAISTINKSTTNNTTNITYNSSDAETQNNQTIINTGAWT